MLGGDARQADQMAVGEDVELVRLAQGVDAVFEHRAAVAQDQRDRQTGVVILARHDAVAALGGEQLEPAIVMTEIEQRAVFGEQRVHR